MAVNKVEIMENGSARTIIDLTEDTVEPEALAEGYTAHDPSGQKITGKMPTTTVLYTEQTLTEEQKAQARENIGVSNISYGVCETESEVVDKIVTVDGDFELKEGAIVIVRFINSNGIAAPTLNVNGTGAKPMYRYGTTTLSTGTTTTGWTAGAIQMFVYNGTGWIRDYWNNTTYSNASLGHGYVTCSTAEATTAKTASLSSYALTTGGRVTVKFTNAVPANSTLNIASKGAKDIYYRGAKIKDGVIKAGDTATFIYSSYYHLISIDRWQADISELSETIADYPISVKNYGAKGDGATDDTTAIQTALAENRKVYIPAGTYKLSGELVIRDNCELTLAQDTVLSFTQTSGNCITLNRSATIRGNHATIKVPYSFSGKAINVDTTVHTDTKDVPPFIHWDPQWKTGRYMTDINICKADSYGVHRSTSGESNGTAIYICANGSATSTFIWGLNFSGVRIAGAFEYGIRAVTLGSGYNHEMRIEAFMDACKIGVSLEDCNNAYISATVQPRASANGVVYAKHGIQLIRSENTDLSGSRVWDWNDKNSLWTYDKSNINQHIAMYGNCRGTIMNDYNYYHIPSGFTDIRELIYTDTSSNFNSLIILQEPFTRWFKPIDNEPYFDNGDGVKKRLVLKSEQDALFETSYIPAFDDKLSKASDGAGAIFNEIGYQQGYYWNTNGTSLVSSQWHVSTGLIQCGKGAKLYLEGMSYDSGDDNCRIILFDSSGNRVMHVNRGNILTTGGYYVTAYESTDNGCIITLNPNLDIMYVRISVYTTTVGSNPVIAVNEEITYTQVGTMTSGVKVHESNLIGMDNYEKKGRMTTQISSVSTNEQYPTAKAVYNAIQDFLGVVENGTY